jgi:hypothetical protein
MSFISFVLDGQIEKPYENITHFQNLSLSTWRPPISPTSLTISYGDGID